MSDAKTTTVRDAVFDVLREQGIRKIFANPGSTEISLLSNFPKDLEFILGLHEGSCVGMATGLALATGEPTLAIVHTTPGLGNAVTAIATARVNNAPVAIIVGQQDRRHLATEPFLAGKLRSLAGEYPVWFSEPATAQDVPAAVARAIQEARYHRGPAIVVVPMDDWAVTVDPDHVFAAPAEVHRGANVAPETIAQMAKLIDSAKNPAIVAGAGNDSFDGWAAAVALAEHIAAPVFQESFAGQAGFPQHHPQFAGFLSSSKSVMREQLAEYDLILSVGAPVFRQYNFEPGALVNPTTMVLLLTESADEAMRSPATLAAVGALPDGLIRLSEATKKRPAATTVHARRPLPATPGANEPLRASHVMGELATRLPENVVLVEETPSSRPDLHDLLPAKQPLGFVSAAMGGLGFGLPAAIGLRMGNTERPVVAILGDGSALYQIQGLWSARHYEVGTLFIILNNSRYAVMDRLADKFGSGGPAWPAFSEIDFVQLSESLGVESIRISDHDTLLRTLDAVIPTLANRNQPLTLIIDVEPELTFAP